MAVVPSFCELYKRLSARPAFTQKHVQSVKDGELIPAACVFSAWHALSLLRNTAKAADILRDDNLQADGKAEIVLFPYLHALGDGRGRTGPELYPFVVLAALLAPACFCRFKGMKPSR